MIVGLTGGIGSGKSTAVKIFNEFGIDSIDADDCLLYTSPSPRDRG